MLEISEAEAKRRGAEADLIFATWATALFVPLVGFVLGTILVTKGKLGHGVWSMIASVFMTAAFAWGLLHIL